MNAAQKSREEKRTVSRAEAIRRLLESQLDGFYSSLKPGGLQ